MYGNDCPIVIKHFLFKIRKYSDERNLVESINHNYQLLRKKTLCQRKNESNKKKNEII